MSAVHVLSPESLSMNCDLKCDMCDESVNYGDDYIAHLQIAHGISKNINYFMDKALNEITNRKTDDNVTLEEESSRGGGTDPDNVNESDPYVIDEETKRNIEKTVEKTMGDLFKNIKLMVDGEIPLDDDNDDDDLDIEDATEDKIWESFEKLKEIVNNMEFPPELLQELAGNSEVTNEKNNETVSKKRNAIDPPAQEKDKVQKFPRPQSSNRIQRVANERQKKLPSPVPPSAEKLRPTPSPKAAPPEPTLPIDLKAPSNLGPIKSDKSDQAVNSPSITHFLCPIDHCSFSTTKQGMMDGAAASHLNKIHKITGPDMKNAPKGTYKFKKVKGEIKV